MTMQIEPGDIEQELRELFREKAGEAPLSTPRAPATAPPQVLRRGRRRQVGTVLGSLAVVAVLAAGSVAGLQRLLGDQEPLPTGRYDVFERTATVEAFTVTSPSDWYLVNKWPESLQTAVTGTSGSSSFKCQAVPIGSGDEPECVETVGEETSTPLPLPFGLPMIQLTNVDLGLSAVTCGAELGDGLAVLYVAYDAERGLSGIADPSIPPFPPGEGLPPESDGPCGPGRYARFTVNGEPFFAWIGLGPTVSDQDRETVETSYEQMSAIDDWMPQPPDQVTPGYVIAGGADDTGDPWRLEARHGQDTQDVELGLVTAGGTESVRFDIEDLPVGWCCTSSTGTVDPPVLFGSVGLGSSSVEFQPDGGAAPITGTIMPVPSTIGSDLDLFFLKGATGLEGEVVAVGLGTNEAISPSPSTERREKAVELWGSYERQPWVVRFTGAFAAQSACIDVEVAGESQGSLCQDEAGDSIERDRASMHGWLTPDLYLLAGAVPPEVEEILYVPDDDVVVPTYFWCTMGPRGWTDPDRKVCVFLLPPAGSGHLEYVDANGVVLAEEGIGWGVAESEVPTPVDPVHGGTYWAVYPWIGAPGDTQADEVSAALFEQYGIEALPGDVSCDDGATEALGTDAQRIGVYFETREDAEAFANQLVGGVVTEAPIAIVQVTTYCLD
jgi:hypothetical protein